MLTDRAQKYLTTLQRLPPVPTRDVERALREEGAPCFEVWLDFHELYAGYVEPLGADQAVWGIVHQKSQWIPPGRASVEQTSEQGSEWLVTCADVHGSYVYRLTDTGRFFERSAESFDIKVERNAARMAFARDPRGRAQIWFELKDPAFRERLNREAKVVPEASDRFYRIYLGDSVFAVEHRASGVLVEALVRPPPKS